jgi:hypothetical protein
LKHSDLKELPHIYDLAEAVNSEMAYIYKRMPEP